MPVIKSALGLSKGAPGTRRDASSTGLVREGDLDPAIAGDAVFQRDGRGDGKHRGLVDLRSRKETRSDAGRETVEMVERRARVAGQERDSTEGAG